MPASLAPHAQSRLNRWLSVTCPGLVGGTIGPDGWATAIDLIAEGVDLAEARGTDPKASVFERLMKLAVKAPGPAALDALRTLGRLTRGQALEARYAAGWAAGSVSFAAVQSNPCFHSELVEIFLAFYRPDDAHCNSVGSPEAEKTFRILRHKALCADRPDLLEALLRTGPHSSMALSEYGFGGERIFAWWLARHGRDALAQTADSNSDEHTWLKVFGQGPGEIARAAERFEAIRLRESALLQGLGETPTPTASYGRPRL